MEGWKDLDKGLAELTRATAGNVLTRTLLKAAAPIKDEAVRLAPDDPRTGFPDLRTSIFARKGRNGQVTFRRTVNVMVLAPLVRNEKSHKPTGVFYYARALELGQGDMPFKPYLRPAMEAKRDIAIKIMGDELKSQIEKAVARRNKKLGRA